MLLAVDIGNSSIKFGVFDHTELLDRFAIPTARDYTVEELSFDRLRRNGDRFLKFEDVIVSSVVTELDEVFRRAILRSFNLTPRFVDHTFNFGMEIQYRPMTAVGVDRLVNASSAAARHGMPVIACSFGTATTFDVVTENAEYIGGAIAPGMRTLAESLHLKTSKLPLIAVEKPEKAVGGTTEESIRSGVFNGYIGLVEGILERIFEERSETLKVVGTGGFVHLVAEQSSMIDVVDEDLTLEGLRLLATLNAAKPPSPLPEKTPTSRP